MTHSTTMTLRLAEETLARLDGLAKATDRSKAYLASRAIEEYLETQDWQVQAIKEAVLEADKEGAQFFEHDEVVEQVRQMLGKGSRRRTK